MPRKRSKSPKHRSRSKSRAKSRAKSKAKSRSKSKNRKYGGGGYKLWGEYSPFSTTEKINKYGFPVPIVIQKWTDSSDNYKHPSYLEDDSFFSKKPTLRNMCPSYVERVPLLFEGEQSGYTITKQWRVGSVSNFKFRTATKIPDEGIIKRDLWLGTYSVDFPCFIVYNISKSRNNNLAMLLKVYKLVIGEIETFYIYEFKEKLGNGTVLDTQIIKTQINDQANFLTYIENYITKITVGLKSNNDLPRYDNQIT